MFEHPLDELHSIVYVRPRSKLEQADFEQLAATVDPHIEERGALAGLIIEVAFFRAGTASAPWRAIFALCAIITSTSKRSALYPIHPWELSLRTWPHIS